MKSKSNDMPKKMRLLVELSLGTIAEQRWNVRCIITIDIWLMLCLKNCSATLFLSIYVYLYGKCINLYICDTHIPCCHATSRGCIRFDQFFCFENMHIDMYMFPWMCMCKCWIFSKNYNMETRFQIFFWNTIYFSGTCVFSSMICGLS